MKLKTQKRIAAEVLKCSEKRVYFSPEHLSDIKEAITKQDIRELINANVIQKLPARGVSRARANYIMTQKQKGRRRGQGSRKGRKTARTPAKRAWENRVRAQRKLLKRLRDSKRLLNKDFRELYLKSKGGFFRNVSHLKYYINEKKLIQDVKK